MLETGACLSVVSTICLHFVPHLHLHIYGTSLSCEDFVVFSVYIVLSILLQSFHDFDVDAKTLNKDCDVSYVCTFVRFQNLLHHQIAQTCWTNVITLYTFTIVCTDIWIWSCHILKYFWIQRNFVCMCDIRRDDIHAYHLMVMNIWNYFLLPIYSLLHGMCRDMW